MDAVQLRNILDFAVDAAQIAGRLTLGYFQAGVSHESKTDDSPVTVADRGAEQLLRERIAARFPTHGIVGEEFGETRGGAAARWILDPIDGTFSFIHGVPMYSVLIGFEFNAEMLAGVIHMPALSETVYAARGMGCYWNGRRAQVSATRELAHATVLTAGGTYFDQTGRSEQFDRFRRAGKQHRSWCDAYAYGLVATGRADAVADPRMALWDIAPVYPCVVEAGGRVTNWAGQDTHLGPDGVATNGLIHDAVLKTLR